MIRTETHKPNGSVPMIVHGEGSLPALVQKAANQLASATTAAEVLEARDFASVAYDAAKKAARLAKAKGAHDELIAKAHRAQADALEIEAAAKRRLADEYDAAQERGEVKTRADNQHVPEQNKLSVEEIGLTRKDVFEAREIRDAEEADPGIVHRTVQQQLDAGQEPTKAAVRKAIAKTKEDHDAVEATAVETPVSRHGATMFVPEGEDIVELCRHGITREMDGLTVAEVASELHLSEKAYRICRQIVLLADNQDLSAKDAAVAGQALKILVETKQPVNAWEIAEPLAIKVWGEDRKHGLLGIPAKRLDQFERSFGIVMQACLTTNEINLPYLTADQVNKAIRQIGQARGALERFAKRIKDIHE